MAGLSVILLLAASWVGFRVYQEVGKRNSEDPLVWQEDIKAFDVEAPMPENAVVFVGSSSIRLWDSLVQDMAPLPVIQRGFGGAKLNDLVYYADELVNKFNPMAVVVFAGSNDITPVSVKAPEVLLGSFHKFVAKVRTNKPDLPIYYIGITPSPRRWEVWPRAAAANNAIERYIDATPGLFFIDTTPALLNASGEPNVDNYSYDAQHFGDSGYQIWTSIIRPRLHNDFLEP